MDVEYVVNLIIFTIINEYVRGKMLITLGVPSNIMINALTSQFKAKEAFK